MFIVTAKVPRRRNVLLAALVVLAVLVSLLWLRSRSSAESAEPAVRTNEDRVAYLERLGWQVDPEPLEVVRLTLPETLEEPYRSYNGLQAKQGFDLTPYLGKTLERSTYAVTNHPSQPRACQADLYVCDGAVVAGDVVCTGENGFIATLEFPESPPPAKDPIPAN